MAIGILALFPIVVALGILRTQGPVYWPIVGFFFLLFGFAAWSAVAIGSRTITISPESIELHGFWGRRIPWLDLDKVEGYVLPKRSFVVFTAKNGKAIAVDSTLYGWEEFVEKAPELARGAGPSLARAIERVKGTP